MKYDELLESIDSIDSNISYPAYAWLNSRNITSVGCLSEIGKNEDWKQLAKEVAYLAYEAGKHDAEIAMRGINQVRGEEYIKGYDEAAINPAAWCVVDKDGDSVHIGDNFKAPNGNVYEAIGFHEFGGEISVTFFDDEGDFNGYCSNRIKKVPKDTRAIIISEMIESFVWDGEDIKDNQDATEKANAFYDRIKAVEE